MKRLDELIFSLSADQEASKALPEHTDLLLYAPCPVKLLVKERIEDIQRQESLAGRDLTIQIPMGCTSVDPYDPVCRMTDADKLPDIIASIGFGDFWKRDFAARFLDTGIMGAVLPEKISPLYSEAGLIDPKGRYTVYGSTPYIFLVDERRLGKRPAPRVWADLLDPMYAGEIIMCGDGDDMADAVVLNMYKDFGMEGLKSLAGAAKGLMHSSTMVTVAGTGDKRAGAVFIIPCFFALSVKLPSHLRVVWPEDGASASPLYFIAKKSEQERLRPLIDFFVHDFSRLGSSSWFAPLDGSVPSALPKEARLKWVGWDFIEQHDVNTLRDQLNATFRLLVQERR